MFSFAYLNQESHLSQMKYTGIDLKENDILDFLLI